MTLPPKRQKTIPTTWQQNNCNATRWSQDRAPGRAMPLAPTRPEAKAWRNTDEGYASNASTSSGVAASASTPIPRPFNRPADKEAAKQSKPTQTSRVYQTSKAMPSKGKRQWHQLHLLWQKLNLVFHLESPRLETTREVKELLDDPPTRKRLLMTLTSSTLTKVNAMISRGLHPAQDWWRLSAQVAHAKSAF
jgi:hypothetical protein